VVADVAIGFGQKPQDLAVANGLDGAKVPGPRRRDGDLPGVVRIVLVGAARSQQPGACRQGGGHVEHVLAGGDELLGQQVAHPVGALDGPHTRRERRRPRQQLVDLGPRRPNPLVGGLVLGGALIATAVWDALWGSTPMITCMVPPWLPVGGTAVGTPASGSGASPLAS